ncbi:hypothetical protein C2S52_008449 [Perilla frutescens var. hirtella]|uniref:Uncharacterized protein n=1 Tax=Perilla frutescens var. hirtella TaxID=608512 RepID=A0AAD4NZE4_PERFH|nr:hypothetical protein C2S51_017830 [Perilla frutescens var. frutescens]KAH6783490.1 hypothetical protein C2S52_008449 [Perilla frutescens var. hirtella]KAH6820465.1 hypothetical protein C2S53_002623 [Perilla frutescens var. hirtella]
MVNADRLGNPPPPSSGEAAANAPLNYDERINVGKIKDEGARPPPAFRCVSNLGVCGKTFSEERCIQLCNNYYSGQHPSPKCAQFPGTTDAFCFCEHDCRNNS